MRKWLLHIKAYFVGDELIEVHEVVLIPFAAGDEMEETGPAIGSDERAGGADLQIIQENYDVVPGLSDPVTGIRYDPTLGWSIGDQGAT